VAKMISIMVNEEIVAECHTKGWHYREVFLAGVASKRGMPEVSDRIHELEEGNKKLQHKLSVFWQQLAAMTPKEGQDGLIQ